MTQSTERILVNIDTVGYTEKPKSNMGYINTRVVNNVTEISLADFADQVGNQGKAFTRALVREGYVL